MIPIFGWMEQFVEFIFVKRNWQEDRSQLEKGLSNLTSYPKPFWFIIFPEGTRFNKARMEENQRWSRENGRKPLAHCLWPRAKAFLMTVETLGTTIDACYDATLTFERDVSFFDMLRGRGRTVVHFHVRRYPMATLRTMSPDALSAWLDDRWLEKEALLEKFARDGTYGMPEVAAERPMPSGTVVAAWLLCLTVLLSRIPAVRLIPSVPGQIFVSSTLHPLALTQTLLSPPSHPGERRRPAASARTDVAAGWGGGARQFHPGRGGPSAAAAQAQPAQGVGRGRQAVLRGCFYWGGWGGATLYAAGPPYGLLWSWPGGSGSLRLCANRAHAHPLDGLPGTVCTIRREGSGPGRFRTPVVVWLTAAARGAAPSRENAAARPGLATRSTAAGMGPKCGAEGTGACGGRSLLRPRTDAEVGEEQLPPLHGPWRHGPRWWPGRDLGVCPAPHGLAGG